MLSKTLFSLLGDLPSFDLPITAEVVSVTDGEDYRLEKIQLCLDGVETTEAYVTLPRCAAPPYKAVIFHHSHGANFTIGKEEFIAGREYMAGTPYALDLARRGIAGVCIDCRCFGVRRRNDVTQTGLALKLLWDGQVLWGMMVYDAIRTIDYLLSRSDIDSNRIGVMGMSMGATMSWWHAALDPRVKVCVDICCLTDMDALVETNGMELHGPYYFVPGLRKHTSTAEICALICPRPHLSVNGRLDPLTPEQGLYRLDDALQKAYLDAGCPERWRLSVYDVAHQETEEARQEVLGFLEKWL